MNSKFDISRNMCYNVILRFFLLCNFLVWLYYILFN
nr:MAG TPA: hypothetical protein [Caudoviricetes sp.]DAH62451.1 MAG TPA: hypothetical protein [Caudoviricetes sp.]